MARTFGSTKLEFNQQLVDEWRQFGKCGLKFATIARLKCVDASTISRYHNEHPELKLAYDEGLSNCEKSLKIKAIELAEDGNLEAIKYVNKHLTDWKDHTQIEGGSTHNHLTMVITNKSDLPIEIQKRIDEFNSLPADNSQAQA